MIKTKLGKSQYLVSKIALGTVQFGLDYGFDKSKTQYEVDLILNAALKNGINFIDTAREYGDSERKIGNYLARHNSDFIVATKLRKLSQNEVRNKSIKDKIFCSIEDSLIELKLQNLSVLQLHQTDEHLISKEILWNTIRDLKKNKTIGAFGVSIYDINEALHLMENYAEIIDFFQVPYNIFDRRFESLQAALDKHSISLVSRSTFLKGIIPCDNSELPLELEDLKSYKEKLQKKAADFKMSVSELAMLYVCCSQHITSTLVGVNSPKELDSNVDVIKKHGCGILAKEDLSDLLVGNAFLVDPRKWANF